MSALAELTDAQNRARQYQSKLESDRDHAERVAREDFDRHSEDRQEFLAALNRKVNEKREAYEAAQIAKTRERSGKDIGTIVVEWVNGRTYFGSRQTGRKGRIDVWTADTAHPENFRWSLPSVGDLFIRVLKANGKDALTFETMHGGYKAAWLPLGVKPPV